MAEGSVNAQKALFKPIAKVVASGNQKVVITLKNPTGHFLFNLGWGDAVMVDQEVRRQTRVNLLAQVLLSSSAGSAVTGWAGPNPNYWGEKPALKTATFKFIPDAAAAVADHGGDVDALPIFLHQRWQVSSKTTHGSVSSKEAQKVKPFSQRTTKAQRPSCETRHRACLECAGNCRWCNVRLWNSHGTHFAPHHPAYVDLKGLYPHDPEKAKALLAEAGFQMDSKATLKLPRQPMPVGEGR